MMTPRKLIALAGVTAFVAVGCGTKATRKVTKPANPTEAITPTTAATSTPRAAPARPAPVAAPEPDYSKEPLPEPEVSVEEVKAVLEKLQVSGERDIGDVGKRLVKMGATGLRHLTGMLKDVGEGDETDRRARHALSGLAFHVILKGAGRERSFYARTLAGELSGEKLTKQTKGFVVRQLRVAGGRECAEALGGLLLDKELSEYAAQALLSIRKGAAPEFRKALAGAKGATLLTITQALGVLRDGGSVEKLLPATLSPDRDLRLATLWALANIGDPRAEGAILKSLAVESPYEKARATEAVFLFIDRLIEEGRKDIAARISRDLWENTEGEENCHIRCAALQGLARAVGSRAMGELRSAMKSEDMHIRTVAAEAALMLPGEDVTRQWVDQLKAAATPTQKIDTLNILARRGDPSALEAVFEILKDPDEAVQIAAMDAVARLGGAESVKPLVASLSSEAQGEREAAAKALARLRGVGATRAVAGALGKASGKVKCALLGVLAARGASDHLGDVIACFTDIDDSVRAAAWTSAGEIADERSLDRLLGLVAKAEGGNVIRAAGKAIATICSRAADQEACAAPVIRAMRGAPIPTKCALLGVLGAIGGSDALVAVGAAWDDTDDAVKDAVVRALGEWPNDTSAAKLMAIVKAATKVTHRVLALRGYVRVVGLPSDRSVDDTLALYRDAMAVATRADEKKLVLAGLGGVGSLDALRIAEKHIREPGLTDEACMAAVQIARAIGMDRRDEAMKALEDVVGLAESDHVRERARKAIALLKRFDDCVTTWLVSDAYTKNQAPGGDLLAAELPPERPGADVNWRRWSGKGEQPLFVDFMRMKGIGGNDRAAYLRASVYSPADQDARLELGSDDQVKVWLNAKPVHTNDAWRGYQEGQDKVNVRLEAGWNVLLAKIVQGGGDWSTGFRIRARDGSKLKGLRIKAE
jgi:HEAT repeat protein